MKCGMSELRSEVILATSGRCFEVKTVCVACSNGVPVTADTKLNFYN